MPESWGINFVCMIISSSGQNGVDANLFTPIFQVMQPGRLGWGSCDSNLGQMVFKALYTIHFITLYMVTFSNI